MRFIEKILMHGLGTSAVGVMGLAIRARRNVTAETAAAVRGQPGTSAPWPGSVIGIDQAADRPAGGPQG